MKFGIDIKKRVKHDALLDSQILSEVYLELIGGKQPGFVFQNTKRNTTLNFEKPTYKEMFTRKENLTDRLTEKERSDHKDFVSKLNNNFWYN